MKNTTITFTSHYNKLSMDIRLKAEKAVKSNSSVGLQENGNYIFKAKSGKAVYFSFVYSIIA